MRLAELRSLLPGVEIEDDPYCVGYWSRWAGQECPAADGEQREGWEQADREIAAERVEGSIVVGASERIADRR